MPSAVAEHQLLGRRVGVGAHPDARLDAVLGEARHDVGGVEVLHAEAVVVDVRPVAPRERDELRTLADAEHGDRRRVPVALGALRGDERQAEHALVELDRARDVGDGERDVVHRGHRNRGGGRLGGRGAGGGGARRGARGDDQRRQGEHQLAACHAPVLEPLDELFYACAHCSPPSVGPGSDVPATESRRSVDRSRSGSRRRAPLRAAGRRSDGGIAAYSPAPSCRSNSTVL